MRCSFDGLSTDVEKYFEELGFQYSRASRVVPDRPTPRERIVIRATLIHAGTGRCKLRRNGRRVLSTFGLTRELLGVKYSRHCGH